MTTELELLAAHMWRTRARLTRMRAMFPMHADGRTPSIIAITEARVADLAARVAEARRA